MVSRMEEGITQAEITVTGMEELIMALKYVIARL